MSRKELVLKYFFNMNYIFRFFIYYLVFINVVCFIAFGLDKYYAVKGKWRIREATLLTFAGIGGSAGAIAGMYIFRHKTKKPVFYIGIHFIMVMQLVLIYFIFIKINR